MPAVFPRLSRPIRSAAEIGLLAATYFVTARIGLSLDPVSGVATLVWPPTGLALAALLLFGVRLWPGIALGALVANLSIGVPMAAASGIALGNTLEAVVASYLLTRRGFDPTFTRLRSVVSFAIFAGLLATTVSATIGVWSAWLGGVVPTAALGAAWSTWWLGDMVGALVVTPLLVISYTSRRWVPRGRRTEAACVLAAVGGTAFVVFGEALPATLAPFHHSYLLVPPLTWAALRLGPWGASVGTAGIAAAAIVAATLGTGPFVHPELWQSLFSHQAFMAILAVGALLLAALVTERDVRSELIAVASHELRGPINALGLQFDILVEGVRRVRSVEQVEHAAELIRRQLGRLTELVNELFDLTRISAGRMTLRRDELDLAPLVAEIAGRLGVDLARAGCPVHLDLEPATGRWDRSKIDQIVTNLITNAIKHAPANLITISVEATDRIAEVRVRDHGPGIARADQARIFEAFESLGGPTSGFGLGLFISREIAVAHGGTLTVESKPGAGATFTLRLPR